jgi:hypothetical protein
MKPEACLDIMSIISPFSVYSVHTSRRTSVGTMEYASTPVVCNAGVKYRRRTQTLRHLVPNSLLQMVSKGFQLLCVKPRRALRGGLRAAAGQKGLHPVSVASPLPELARIGTRKHGWVFLGLVAEDGGNFVLQLRWCDWDRHLYFVGLKLLPGSPIQPHLAVLEPGLMFNLLYGQHYRVQAGAVGAVRVR